MNRQSRYYGLRVVSTLYKVLAILTILFCLGAIGYFAVQAINSPGGDAVDFQIWLGQTLSTTLGGGFLALLLYVLSQLIDVQLSINENLRQIAKQAEQSVDTTKVIEAVGRQISGELEQMRLAIRQQRVGQASSPPQSQHPPVSASSTQKIT